jgi:hypothetical protein
MRLPAAVRSARSKLWSNVYRGAIKNFQYSRTEAKLLADEVLKEVKLLPKRNSRKKRAHR